ncbi:MAG: CehA/McbA family metallohydrolase [Phycisphaeraceae bacterium]
MPDLHLDHPYADLPPAGRWLRGNLHAHTTRSDGRREPQVVIDDYHARGYDFLMISDHDIFTSAADHQQWDARGMTLIAGNEISRGGPHLLHVGATRFIEPDPLRQNVLNAAAAPGEGLIFANHPNWQARFDHCPIHALEQWVGYTGLEIFNGTIGRLQGSPYATNKWDILLTAGRRVWGIATDDSHSDADVGLGWTCVWVQEASADAIVDALRLGRCYASTGVTIDAIDVVGPTIRIHAPNARRIVALTDAGRRVKVADGPTIEVDGTPEQTYLRFECWGDGEQFAWTQPFFVSEAAT